MIKFEYTGSDRSTVTLQEALQLVESVASALRGGDTECEVQYEKSDEGSVLQIRTYRLGKPVTEAAKPVTESRRGRKKTVEEPVNDATGLPSDG